MRAQNHRTIVISSMKKKLLKANCTLNGYYKIWQISPEGKVCETSRLKPSPRSRPGVKQKLTYTRISKRSNATVCSKINVQAGVHDGITIMDQRVRKTDSTPGGLYLNQFSLHFLKTFPHFLRFKELMFLF